MDILWAYEWVILAALLLFNPYVCNELNLAWRTENLVHIHLKTETIHHNTSEWISTGKVILLIDNA